MTENDALHEDQELTALQSQLQETIRNGERSRLALLSILEDEKLARLLLKQQEEQYRTLVEGMNEGLIHVDNDDIIQFVNDRFCELCDYAREELIGQVGHRLLFDESTQEVVRQKNLNRIAKQSEKYEVKLRRRDGQERWVYVSGAPVIGPDGAVTGSIGAFTDISERKQAEDAAQASELRYRTFVNSTSDLAFLKDDQMRYLMINEANRKFFSRTEEEIIGKTDFELMPQEHALACRRTDLLALESNRVVINEETIGGKIYETRKFPVKLEGRKTGVGGFIRDITEHRKADLALRDSEERFRSVFENTFIGIYRTTPDGRILMANPALITMLGYQSFGEFSQRNLERDGYHPVYDRATFKQLLEQANEVIGHEAPWKHRNGTTIWVRESARAIRDESGQVSYYEGTVEDITSRKEAELALQQSEARFRQLAENIEQVYWLTDWKNKKLLYVNPSFEKLYGRSCQSAYENRMNWTEVIHPDDREWVTKAFSEKTLQGLPAEVEYRIVGNDGSIRWVYDRSVPIRDQTGTVILIASVAEDITVRKNAEITLRESEAKFRTMVENINDVIFSVNPAGVVTYISPAIERIVQYKVTEITGQLFAKFIHPDDLAALNVSFARNLDGVVEPSVYRIIDRDGSVKHVRSASHLVTENGAAAGITGTLTDYTHQHRIELEKAQVEDDLRQAQKMEAIGQLAGGVAHDFNNMLTGIMGNGEMLMIKLANEPTLLELSERIVHTAETAAKLTRQLLSFARKGKYEMGPVDIHKLVADAAGILGNTIDRRIRIQQSLGAGRHMVMGDPGQLENALINLGLNARDAMPQGGELVFSTEVVELDDDYIRLHGYRMTPGDYIQTTVTDTGTGMPPEVRAHIFEPFFTTKEPGKGTGLGLASVYGIVKGHNGSIEVYSEVGHGTAIKIFLPLIGSSEVVSTAAKPEPITAGHGSILLVDDEQMIREIASQMLQNLGYQVATCGDGQEAIEYFTANHNTIDLVILDMIMPKLNGRETYQLMRKIDNEVKVILSSGFSAEGEAQELMKMGINGFVQKPYRLKELAAKIAEALGRSSAP